MTIDDIFESLTPLNRWVPYKLVYNPKREKFDKVPHNGRYGLKTTDESNWTDLIAALAIVNEQYGLSGVGFVTTNGLELDGWSLVGFDFDDVTDKFKPPINTYSERSPSKVGVRSFAWAPKQWVEAYQDTLDCKPKHCAHAEIYIGTAPRFLTVTFDAINELPIKQLNAKDLTLIESWGMHKREAPEVNRPMVDTAGEVLDLDKFKLTVEQMCLVGSGGDGHIKIDRSKTMMGFIINLLDGGASQEDVLATLAQTPTLWKYLLEHRGNDEAKALEFAKSEINRAFPLSMPGKREALIGFNSKWKVIEDSKEKDSTLDFPMEIYTKAPGLVGEIAKWILAASYVPREEYAYAAALATVACLIGPYCTHGAGSRSGKLNLFLTLVGNTGAGKTEAITGMGLLLSETDAKDCILDFPASEAALRRQLTLTPNIVLKVDELAHKLEGMRDNTNGSSMGRAILEAYDGERMPPKVYADSKNTLPAVENPFVQIIGGTTDKVWNVVRVSHMEDGTLNRFMFVCLVDEPEYRWNDEPEGIVPKALKEKLNTFWRAGRMADLVGDVQGFKRHIGYHPDVKKAVSELNRAAWDLQQGEYGNLYPRYVQNTMKVAAILAAGDDRKTVSMRDFEQAQKFTKWSITNTAAKVGAYMSETVFGRLEKRLLGKLKKAGGYLTVREAYKFMHLTRREMEELIHTLILQGEIDLRKDGDSKLGSPEYIVLL